ncbi:MAG: protein-glutamate O-methyltransferase CheR [Flavobacteriales bacterium]|nr:protein-glutamate O-methyltransferase CheR [Flavobacteriales bacterium]
MLKTKEEIENIEITQLLEAVYQIYGYDFRQYARSTVKRRIKHRMEMNCISHITSLTEQIIHNPVTFNDFMFDLSITVTEMFRDPEFYIPYKKHIVPFLKTYSFSNVWHVGCATGEEVYSMAIFLSENQLLKKTTQYATDFNDHSLKILKDGIYPMGEFKKWQNNYLDSGGVLSLSEYIEGAHSAIQMKKELSENFVIANHNLVTDKNFAKMQLIICKNVLIYFSSELQNKVIELFFDALVPGGVLCLGKSESINFTPHQDKFKTLDRDARIFQKEWSDNVI